MARLRALLAILIACPMAAFAQPAARPSDWVVTTPGAWQQADCLPVNCGGNRSALRWLALAPDASGWSLRAVDLDWDPAKDDLVSPFPRTVAFLHHASLRPGAVPTPASDLGKHPRRFTRPGASLTLAFNGRTYRIVVENRNAVVHSGDRQSILGRVDPGRPTDDAYTTTLIWAGDLDHDGMLDFIVGNDNAGADEEVCLYLSSVPSKQPGLATNVGCEVWAG